MFFTFQPIKDFKSFFFRFEKQVVRSKGKGSFMIGDIPIAKDNVLNPDLFSFMLDFFDDPKDYKKYKLLTSNGNIIEMGKQDVIDNLHHYFPEETRSKLDHMMIKYYENREVNQIKKDIIEKLDKNIIDDIFLAFKTEAKLKSNEFVMRLFCINDYLITTEVLIKYTFDYYIETFDIPSFQASLIKSDDLIVKRIDKIVASNPTFGIPNVLIPIMRPQWKRKRTHLWLYSLMFPDNMYFSEKFCISSQDMIEQLEKSGELEYYMKQCEYGDAISQKLKDLKSADLSKPYCFIGKDIFKSANVRMEIERREKIMMKEKKPKNEQVHRGNEKKIEIKPREKFSSCFGCKRDIFINSEYMVTTCEKKCSLNFHTECYNKFKRSENGHMCKTPDCNSEISLVMFMKDEPKVIFKSQKIIKKCELEATNYISSIPPMKSLEKIKKPNNNHSAKIKPNVISTKSEKVETLPENGEVKVFINSDKVIEPKFEKNEEMKPIRIIPEPKRKNISPLFWEETEDYEEMGEITFISKHYGLVVAYKDCKTLSFEENVTDFHTGQTVKLYRYLDNKRAFIFI